MLVPKVGVEPTHNKVLVPKTSVSTIPPLRYINHIRQVFYFPHIHKCNTKLYLI